MVKDIINKIKNNSTRYCIALNFNDINIGIFSNEKKAIIWLDSYRVGYWLKKDMMDASEFLYCWYVKRTEFNCIMRTFQREDKIGMFFKHMGYMKIEQSYNLYYDPTSRYFHIVDGIFHYILITEGEDEQLRIPERVTKTLFWSRVRNDHLRFHAASVSSTTGEGALIIGPKGYGKTTLLLGAILNGACIGSNDRTEVLENSQNSLLVYGVPTSVRLTKEQINYLEEKKNTPFPIYDFKDLKENSGKYEYSPKELSNFVMTPISNGKNLKYVLVPLFSNKKIEIKRIDGREKKIKLLCENVIQNDAAFYPYFTKEQSGDIVPFLTKIADSSVFYQVKGWLYDFDFRMLI